MRRFLFSRLAVLALIQFILSAALCSASLAQEWKVRVKPKGTLKVVDLLFPSVSMRLNCSEGLVGLDRDNNLVPALAEDWRWIDDQTIEFKLRRGIFFHNGEEFNAETVRVNWENYRKMKVPGPERYMTLPDETKLEIPDDYRVKVTFPEPDGLAIHKFPWFVQIAPAFFNKHQFAEYNWGHLTEPGPWGTGPFKLIEGGIPIYGRLSDRIVLEAYENYWDPQYPKVQRVIFDNTLLGNRDEAMRLCRETEGAVDIVSHIRPLDTLKVAESPFAKVVKSKDGAFFCGYFNQRKRDSKWRDVRLRKAINYAINRKELWKYAAKGNAYNLEGFPITTREFGFNPDLNEYAYDTDEARSLLTEAGYPNGFQMEIITIEARKLEAQIISKMLERVGIKVELNILKFPEFAMKTYIPALEGLPEEQEWDLAIISWGDWVGHTAASFLTLTMIEEGDWRWTEHDPVYEKMWKDMQKELNPEMQEEKIRQMVEYVYKNAHFLFIYSPLSLYAVNKEVNFVPEKFLWLRLKETSVTDNHWSVRGQSE